MHALTEPQSAHNTSHHHVLGDCSVISRWFFCGADAQRGPWPPHSRGFQITHDDAPQSVGLLWTGDQFVAETST